MTSTDPLDRLAEAILTDVVGFEVDGIRVLGAMFDSQPFIGPYGGPQYSVTLVLTDPPDPPGWPRGAARTIHRHAYDTMYSTNAGIVPALRYAAAHRVPGYDGASR